MKRRRDIDLVKVRRGGRKKTKQNKKNPPALAKNTRTKKGVFSDWPSFGKVCPELLSLMNIKGHKMGKYYTELCMYEVMEICSRTLQFLCCLFFLFFLNMIISANRPSFLLVMRSLVLQTPARMWVLMRWCLFCCTVNYSIPR